MGKECDTSLLRLGRARGPAAGEDSPRGQSWEHVRRRRVGKQAGGWGADGSRGGVECATHVHTCPLLRSAWLEEWEREAEENGLWVVWAGGGGVGRV